VLPGDCFEPQDGEAFASNRHSEYRVITLDASSGVEAITRSYARPDRDGHRTYVLSGQPNANDKVASTWPSYASVEVRYSPISLPEIVIIDRDAAHILSEGQGWALTRLPTVIREPNAVAALTAIFDGMWAAATVPSQTERARPFDPPSPAVVAVLHALASGLTHEAVARQLDQSVRTIRRRISEAYAQLGAVGAFQAGYEATRRGWL
jgi:hypothetical protein